MPGLFTINQQPKELSPFSRGPFLGSFALPTMSVYMRTEDLAPATLSSGVRVLLALGGRRANEVGRRRRWWTRMTGTLMLMLCVVWEG